MTSLLPKGGTHFPKRVRNAKIKSRESNHVLGRTFVYMKRTRPPPARVEYSFVVVVAGKLHQNSRQNAVLQELPSLCAHIGGLPGLTALWYVFPSSLVHLAMSKCLLYLNQPRGFHGMC